MGFNHPNIVQIYDFGEENNQPYIAMEWVDGKNLRQILNFCLERGIQIPVDFVCLIIEQAAAGLNYAHHFKDKITNSNFNIIHRDVSPQNILVSYEGGVKLIDFGIAKASVNLEATRTGVIKGKPSYLSPEQVQGDVLDQRSDIFSLGTVLWELLTGRKLFSGESDLAVLKMIDNVSNVIVPPSHLNKKVPAELDQIVLKSLKKKKEERFFEASELQEALHKFMSKHYLDTNAYSLSHFLKDLFKVEMNADRQMLQKLNEKAEQLLSLNVLVEKEDIDITHHGVLPNFEITQQTEPERIPEKSDEKLIEKKVDFSFPEQEKFDELIKKAEKIALPKRSIPRKEFLFKKNARVKAPFQKQKSFFLLGEIAFFFFLFFLISYGFSYFFPQKSPDFLMAYHHQINRIFHVADHAANMITDQLIMQTSTGEPASIENAVSPVKTKVILSLNVKPQGGIFTATVNGTILDYKNPLVQVETNSLLVVRVEKKDYRIFETQLELKDNQVAGLNKWPMDIELLPLHPAYLTLRSTPSADVILEGKNQQWKMHTPIQKKLLPAGEYQLTIFHVLLGREKKMSFSLQEAQTKNLEINLH
jgi:serine/threonine-protein kinase